MRCRPSLFFVFPSRRRHTRLQGDWSSDVCSSDLFAADLPAPAAGAVDFAKDVQPIFAQHCYECHGEKKQKSDYRLDDRANAMKGGEVGKTPIVIGKSAESPLILRVAGMDPDEVMPPKGEKLTTVQVGVLRAWIDQGAKWPDEMARG